jgi:hypothetical protein
MKNNSITGFTGFYRFKWTKLFCIMKLWVLFMFVCMAQLYAAKTYSQSTVVHIRKSTLSLQELISEVESQTDFLFIFSRSFSFGGFCCGKTNRGYGSSS